MSLDVAPIGDALGVEELQCLVFPRVAPGVTSDIATQKQRTRQPSRDTIGGRLAWPEDLRRAHA